MVNPDLPPSAQRDAETRPAWPRNAKPFANGDPTAAWSAQGLFQARHGLVTLYESYALAREDEMSTGMVAIETACEALLARLQVLLPGPGGLSVNAISRDDRILFRCRRSNRMGLVDVEVSSGAQSELVSLALHELAMTDLDPIEAPGTDAT